MRARPSVAVIGALVLLLLQALPAGPLLEYRRDLLPAEPWRALTAHAVHINWTHALVNAAAWLLIDKLFAAQLAARRQIACLALAAPAISAGLLLDAQIAWYRGASGVLHALFFAAVAAMLIEALRARRSILPAAALLVGGGVKLALEWPAHGDAAFVPWLGAAVVPQAHLYGALAGTAFGLVVARRAVRT